MLAHADWCCRLLSSDAVAALRRQGLACHGGSRGYGPGFFLYTAPGWDSPASAWSTGIDVLEGITGGVRFGSCEDPSLSINPVSGAFRILAHCYSTIDYNGTLPDAFGRNDTYCAGQLFSPDGSPKSWRFHGQDHAPYGFASGSMVLSTRERPTLVQDAVTGRPVALINGVSPLAPVGERNVR